jgi:hypothetical protein
MSHYNPFPIDPAKNVKPDRLVEKVIHIPVTKILGRDIEEKNRDSN